MATDLLGRWGESLGAEYLRKQGYVLRGANYRCRFGEIDLIALQGKTLVFVEVKLRKSADFALAMEAVTLKKQSRIKKAAAYYLGTLDREDLAVRFDVIEIYAPEGLQTKRPRIQHLEDAFQ